MEPNPTQTTTKPETLPTGTPETMQAPQVKTPPAPIKQPDLVGSPVETPIQEPPPVKPEAPVYKSSAGEFATTEDLVKHTQSLEEKVLQRGLQQFDEDNAAAQKIGETPEGETADAKLLKQIGELWITDPVEAGRLTDERSEKRQKVQKATEEKSEKFWNGFYDENPNLQQRKNVVKFIMSEHWEQLDKLPPHEAQKILVEKTTKFLAEAGVKNEGVATDLVKTKSTALGVSGEPATQLKEEKAPEIVNFCDQVKRLQIKTG